MDTDRYVIVGAGLAGAKAAEALREQGAGGEVVLLGSEPDPPYDRPPLSKEYLQGQIDRDAIFVHEPDWYDVHDIQLRTSTTVSGIDRASHRLRLAEGDHLDYTKLLLATGSSPRRLPIPGADLDGVRYLRSVGESERLRETIADTSRIVIVGAGWIGLEAAAAARLAGVEVTVLETATQPLARVLGPEIAPVFTALHREYGVDLRLGVALAEIPSDGHNRATGVRLADDTRIDADAVLLAVGATPNTALAEHAGLAVDDGVLVDDALRTDDPDIHAAGDIARARHPLLESRIRVQHWATALHQPATATRAMLGYPASFDALPYFFTDQYDLGMEYVGSIDPHGYDQVVVRGDTATREFLAFWLRDQRVLAGMNVNIWNVTADIKALIHAGTPIDTARLADPQVPLQDLTPTATHS